jgi:hypothetical protein
VYLIVDAGEETIDAGTTAIQIRGPTADAVISHQALHPTPPDTFAVAFQAGVNSWAAVRLSTFVVHLANALNQAHILLRSRARWTITPSVITAGTDSVETAQLPHRPVRLLVDEGEDIGLGMEVNAIAFLKGHVRSATARKPSSRDEVL